MPRKPHTAHRNDQTTAKDQVPTSNRRREASAMLCTVALPSSPVFSPSRRSLSCKASASAAPDPSPGPPASAFASSPFRRFALRAPRCEEASPSTQATAAAGAPALKRQRPAPLLVPVVTAAAAAATVGLDGRSEVEEEGVGFAAYCRRGKGRRRVEMEDRHVAKASLGGDPRVAFFGVFDGHGGKNAAEFAAANMPGLMAEQVEKVESGGCGSIEEAVRRAYLRTDEEFTKEQESGGACCVTAMLRGGRLLVSNAGDCRAVLSRAGKAKALTSDHRASRDDEKARIENLGGLVMNYRGTWRVQGSLAVTRGIGDAHLKPWVVAEPDTTAVPLHAQCEFLILASDGLWDKVGNQEAVDIARPHCTGDGKPPPSSRLSACRRLAELAVSRGSTDDISVVIIELQHFLSS